MLKRDLETEALLRIQQDTELLGRLEQELQEFPCRVERLTASIMALGGDLRRFSSTSVHWPGGAGSLSMSSLEGVFDVCRRTSLSSTKRGS